MMKKPLLFSLYISILMSFVCCKKNSRHEVIPEPIPVYGFMNAIDTIEFEGAESVTVDAAKYRYFVKMKKGFADKNVTFTLKVKEGVTVYSFDSWEYAIPKSSYSYDFRGKEPLMLQFKVGPELTSTSSIYIHILLQDSPVIELTSKEVMIPGNGTQIPFPLNFTSGIGTIPFGTEGFDGIRFEIVEKSGNKKYSGEWTSRMEMLLDKPEYAQGLIDKETSVRIYMQGLEPWVFDNVKFLRGKPKLTIPGYNPLWFITKQPGELISVRGEGIVKGLKYKAILSDDYGRVGEVALTTGASDSNLSGSVPDDLPSGAYLVTFLEDEKVVDSDVIFVSKDNMNMISSIWKGYPGSIIDGTSASHPSFQKGQTFFAKELFPKSHPQTGGYLKAEDVPVLRLKDGSEILDLKPEHVLMNWGIAGYFFSMGKYMIPQNAVSGTYEATLVYPNGEESIRYWSKVKIE